MTLTHCPGVGSLATCRPNRLREVEKGLDYVGQCPWPGNCNFPGFLKIFDCKCWLLATEWIARQSARDYRLLILYARSYRLMRGTMAQSNKIVHETGILGHEAHSGIRNFPKGCMTVIFVPGPVCFDIGEPWRASRMVSRCILSYEFRLVRTHNQRAASAQGTRPRVDLGHLLQHLTRSIYRPRVGAP
ncbi:hypothetical protein BC834DRAFT_657998 [Gloeopeniophorella convolvens]|nr:hypothetical protein BC834DRAFT_657998 [Gloeopeniophorella convolvens]